MFVFKSPISLLQVVILDFLLYFPLFYASIKTAENIGQKHHTADYTKYLIDTNHCKIPKSDIINEKILPLMVIDFPDIDKKPYCHYRDGIYRPPLIISNNDTLFIVEKHKKLYSGPKETLKCSYSPFWKNEPDDRKHVKYGDKVYFENSITIPPNVEFVWAECTVKGARVYHEYHAFVPRKTKSPASPSKHQVNVLVYGIDSLSRVNFHRHMNDTLKLTRELNFIEYFGYNKIADNTYPNVMPILTGYSVNELRTLCVYNDNTYYDDCPFVWKKYKDNNYTTAFIEEQSWSSLFTLLGNPGFIKSPTDYYYYTFDREAHTWSGHNMFRKLFKACLGTTPSQQKTIDYDLKAIDSLKDTLLFSFSWTTSLTHDFLTMARLSDPMYKDLLTALNTSGLLESSVVFLMSDHGIRFGKILNTNEGYLEERLPLFMTSLPSWFPQEYPLAYTNFFANARRLVTHFDTHETLNDLSDLRNIRDDVIRSRTQILNKVTRLPRGISLFLPIPEKRTCDSAEIPSIYCTCISTQQDIVTTTESYRMAHFLVSNINDKLHMHRKCAQLSLKTIKRLQKVEIDGKPFFKVTISTKPGGGIFLALIEHDKDTNKLRVNGDITRLNAYGERSMCVNDPKLKLYCDCT